MAVERFAVDLVVPHKFSRVKRERVQLELQNYLNGVINPDLEDSKGDPNFTTVVGHVHESNPSYACPGCVQLAQDGKS